MNGLMDPSWENWEDTTSGAGTTSVDSNYNLTVSAGSGDVAYKRLTHIANAGETFEFSVDARLTSAATSTPPGIYVDWPASGSLVTYQRLDSEEWKTYTVKFTIPLDHDKTTDGIEFVCGSITADDGSAEYRNPRIEVTNALTTRIWACGLIEIDTAGNTTLVNTSPNVNILNHSYTAPNLQITVPPVKSDTGNDPTPTAFMTTFGPDTYIAKTASTVTGGTSGQFNVKIFDIATGAYLAGNPSSNTRIYIEVKY